VIIGDGEEIKAQTVIWTGGIRGNRLIEEAGFETVRGRVKVDEYMRAPGHDNIFILGDNALVFSPEGRPYPPTAQIAMQAGINCAHNLVALVRNQPLKPFVFQNKGTVASLGKGEAIGIAFGKKYKGRVAAWLKKAIDLRYLFVIGGIPLVLRKGKFL
jgi:NADH dehydrogenase